MHIEQEPGTDPPVVAAHEAQSILEENRKLRESVNTITIDLREKNRLLEIEAALERVRIVAMAMKQPGDMLDVCRTISDQLVLLQLGELRNVQTIIIYESKGIYMNYEYYTRHHKQLVTEVDYFLHPAQLELVHEMQKGPEAFFTKSFSGEEVQKWFEYQKTTPQFLDSYLATATSINWYFYSVGPIGLGISTYAPLNNEEVLLFKRFRNVFELAYRRYLDIEKAEAQTREAQVEAALERVRSHTMAMHSSTDLLQVIKVVGDQLQQLGFPADAVSFITDNTEKGYNMWLASPGDVFLSKVYIPRIDDRTTRMYKEAVEKGEDYYTYLLTKEEKDRYFRNFFENTDLKVTPEEVKQQIFETPGMAAAIAVMDTIILSVTNFRPTPYIEQHNDILKRFAFVFQQSYVRFLDLQKAEAQAREAQIEAALERVRAKVMAMNSSKDLNDASLVFGEQLRALGIHWMFSYFWLIEEGKNENTFWITWPDKKTSTTTYSLAEADESFRECIVAWQRQDKIHATYVPVQDVQAWLDTFERVTLDAGGEAVEVMKADNFKNGVYYYDAMIKFGSFGILINRPISEEEKNIQSRFAVEFERAYTRFLDLQKAEAQTREAKIETALEKVRSHTMGMRSSEDLANVASVMFDQMGLLGGDLFAFGIVLCDKHANMVEQWHSMPGAGMMSPFFVPVDLDHIHRYRYDQWKAGVELFSIEIPEDYIAQHFGLMLELPSVKGEMEKLTAQGLSLNIPTWEIDYGASFSHGYLLVSSRQPFEEESIFPRFAKVFDQAYVRFLDLQKAEAQARESQIEAAVERVRAKALAMHKSEDLHGVVVALKHQLNGLKIENVTAVSMYLEQDDGRIRGLDLSGVSDVDDENGAFKMDVVFRLEDTDPDLWIRRIWNTNEDYFVLEADEADFERIIKWLYTLDPAEAAVAEKVIKENGINKAWLPTVKLQKGKLNIDLLQPPTPEVKSILLKMGAAFDLAYKRYLDLQNAEAQTREAQIEASLERVRSKAMSMHSSQDLADTIGVFYRELHSFSITPRRCGVGLLNKETRVCELFTWNTTDNGESLELVGKIKMDGHPVLENVYNNWLTQTEYHPVLRGTEITEYYKLLRPQMSFPDYGKDEVQFGYFFFFKEGGVYAWTNNEMNEDELNIYRRFNSVLSLTYKRYKDLQLAEAHAIQAERDLLEIKAARMKAEEALVELKTTQQQLIQSEKMASLGELTAGIAHEIQNPLNFVNNFSEVNLELLSEVKEELKQGNVPDALAITEDIERNLEKVAHHGKRADAIVKGMLQHSRKTTGEKESIDINALVDEYIRLSYHGLRAKDKSFNTIIETHFNPSVGKVEIVGQDIGRVLLNLLNNAFYAVNEKKKVNNNGYEPLVQVSTNRLNSTIEIKVKDNGIGIPEKVLDKIYQPFFTTKPTGEGTGLGLSLSYDIITKGHGGEMKVETKEGEFTEFNISLPVL